MTRTPLTVEQLREAIAAYPNVPRGRSWRWVGEMRSAFDAGRGSVTEQRPVSTREQIARAILEQRCRERGIDPTSITSSDIVAIGYPLADAVLSVVQDEREVRADQREQDARIAEDGQFDGDDQRSSDEAAYNTARREAAAAIREGKQL